MTDDDFDHICIKEMDRYYENVYWKLDDYIKKNGYARVCKVIKDSYLENLDEAWKIVETCDFDEKETACFMDDVNKFSDLIWKDMQDRHAESLMD